MIRFFPLIFLFLTFLNKIYGQTTLSDEKGQSEVAKASLPKWSEGDQEIFESYYDSHSEYYIDRMLGYIASSWGIIVHGQLNQEKLSSLLEETQLSQEAENLLLDSLSNINAVYDIHLHNLGYDEGNYLNPKAAAWGIANYNDYFTFMVLRYAAGMTQPLGSTQEARTRLQLYAKFFPKFRGIILPIHQAIHPDGRSDWENTGSYLKNKSALKTASTFESSQSELFPAVSVHPFDLKWEEKLISAYAKGIRLIKWMPPQSIPPDSELLNPYYEKLRELGMVIIAHSGPEHAIPTHEGNLEWFDWGNPLRFRKPLSMGVDVILAHCGHHEMIADIDSESNESALGVDLFIRLAKEAYLKNLTGEWTGRLFGDLAAVTNHYGPDFIKKLLLNINEKGVRIIYGSDYPYTNLVQPGKDAYEICAKEGLLDPQKVKPLKELRNWNPLLANFVFTKNLQLRTEEGEILEFPNCTFDGEFKDANLILVNDELWNSYRKDLLENSNQRITYEDKFN